MGYLVGRHCYETQAEATNHVMTHVLPVIDTDGVLHHPVFNGTTWIFNQQTIQLTFPECDPLEGYQAGKDIGIVMLAIFTAVFMIAVVKSVILSLREKDE